MIDQIKYIWQLLLLTSFLLIVGILLITLFEIPLELIQYLITLLAVTLINLASWIIMVRGIRKSNRDGVLVLLAGIGIKFLLYLLYILVFWLVTKNLTKPFIIVFFTLYLVFTFLLAGHLFKVLKNK
jgi:hypothetical protein